MNGFLPEELSKSSNVTTGKIYSSVIARERHGITRATVQVILYYQPDKRRNISSQEECQADVSIVEGGSWHIESLPFLNIRQSRMILKIQCLYTRHLVPSRAAGELNQAHTTSVKITKH